MITDKKMFNQIYTYREQNNQLSDKKNKPHRIGICTETTVLQIKKQQQMSTNENRNTITRVCKYMNKNHNRILYLS